MGVTWHEAAAYALWAGKRLPTLPEWLTAAGLAAGRPWPWADPDPANPRGNILGGLVAGKPTPELEWACYLSNAHPVRSDPDAATPEGVFHLFGNVSEWTESLAVDFVEQDADAGASGLAAPIARTDPTVRIFAGAAWNALAAHRDPSFIAEYGASRAHYTYHLGFRCAKGPQDRPLTP